ncbi:MAG: hypothetical protein II707_00355 [Spirochaetales bacterium]|nr:hypothetical protein [Spirochaetales bacterium]
MSSIDDVKRRLNIDEMDSDTRNLMFNKFIDGGGEVIKERRQRASVDFDRDKQKEFSSAMKKHRKEMDDKAKAEKQKKASSSSVSHPRKKRPSIIVFFRGMMSGYFTLSGEFNKKFIAGMKAEFQDIMTTLSYATGEVISLDMEQRIGVIDILNKAYPYAYELLLRTYDLYKVNIIEKMQNYFGRYKQIRCPDLVDSVRTLYKDLVILYPYQSSIKDTILQAMTVMQNLNGKEPAVKPNKLSKCIDSLFNYYLPGFHFLLVYNSGKKYPFELQQMRKFIGITDEEDIGSMYKMIQDEKKRFIADKEKEKEEKKKAFEESVEKRESEKIPKFTQKGLTIIDSILEKMPKIKKANPKMKLFAANEKMLYFSAIFDEFDREYSFILTTNQIKLNTRLENGQRTDIKSDFEEENIKYSEISTLQKEYIKLTEEYRGLSSTFANSPLILNQKQTALNIKRSQTFNEIKSKTTLFLKKLCVSLQKLINDYNGERILLQNGDDLLYFQADIGDIRKFEKVKIINAIAATFSFASGIEYYLNYDKLSQKGLFIEEEKKEDKEEKSE